MTSVQHEITRAYCAGATDDEIRDRLLSRVKNRKTLRTLMCRARSALSMPKRRDGLPSIPALAAMVEAETYYAFVDEAKERGLDPRDLLAKLVTVMVEDDLFNAVMGDGRRA